MKWPKKYLDAFTEPMFPNGQPSRAATPDEIMDRLACLGALKERPQPREINWCPTCFTVQRYAGDHAANCDGRRIRFREVIEEAE